MGDYPCTGVLRECIIYECRERTKRKRESIDAHGKRPIGRNAENTGVDIERRTWIKSARDPGSRIESQIRLIEKRLEPVNADGTRKTEKPVLNRCGSRGARGSKIIQRKRAHRRIANTFEKNTGCTSTSISGASMRSMGYVLHAECRRDARAGSFRLITITRPAPSGDFFVADAILRSVTRVTASKYYARSSCILSVMAASNV